MKNKDKIKRIAEIKKELEYLKNERKQSYVGDAIIYELEQELKALLNENL